MALAGEWEAGRALAEEYVAPAGRARVAVRRYRVFPPAWWVPLVAAAVPVWLEWMRQSGIGWPQSLMWVLLVAVVGTMLEHRMVREVTLSDDGRLAIRGLGQKVEVHVSQLTEVRISWAARHGWASARVQWDGGTFRLWPNLRYLPASSRRFRWLPSGWSSDGLRDLVYRIHLINPEVAIWRIAPPAWVRPY